MLNSNVKYCDNGHCQHPCSDCEKAALPMTEKFISVAMNQQPEETGKILAVADLPLKMYERLKI